MTSQRNSPEPGTPAAEIGIDPVLVYELLAHQHPDLAHLPIRSIDAGWDNAMFRLGEQFAVRLPRRAIAAPLIEHEQIWLPHLAPQLSLPVPAPYRVGQPTRNYPWRWSILPWLTGTPADQAPPHADQAKRFATFLRSLHQPAPADAPHNPVRGVPLVQRVAPITERMQRLEVKTNFMTPTLRHLWQQALAAPIDVPANWLHGDLHPRNVLVEQGVITGIIDWGDMTAGDIATDLAAIWMLFADHEARQQVFAAYTNVSEATVQRAQGWAILFGVVLLETGLVDSPRNAVIGQKTLQRVHEDSEHFIY